MDDDLDGDQTAQLSSEENAPDCAQTRIVKRRRKSTKLVKKASGDSNAIAKQGGSHVPPRVYEERRYLPDHEKGEGSTRQTPLRPLPEVFENLLPNALRQAKDRKDSESNPEDHLDAGMSELQTSDNASRGPVSQMDPNARPSAPETALDLSESALYYELFDTLAHVGYQPKFPFNDTDAEIQLLWGMLNLFAREITRPGSSFKVEQQLLRSLSGILLVTIQTLELRLAELEEPTHEKSGTAVQGNEAWMTFAMRLFKKIEALPVVVYHFRAFRHGTYPVHVREAISYADVQRLFLKNINDHRKIGLTVIGLSAKSKFDFLINIWCIIACHMRHCPNMYLEEEKESQPSFAEKIVMDLTKVKDQVLRD